MMGELTFFLGFQIKQLKDGTFISQTKYLKDMLKKFDMENAKPIKTPMPTNGHLDLNEDGKAVDHLGLPLDSHRELPDFDYPFAEWDATDEATVAVAHAPLPRARRQARSPRRHASTSSRRAPPSGQDIFDEEEETEEDTPLDYREHPDSAKDEDTSEDVAQDEDDE